MDAQRSEAQHPEIQSLEMMTAGGVRITRTATPFDPAELGRIAAAADERRGGVMSSGMEYPGRYSRWVMAYADPCAEITATGRRLTARPLNDRGRVLMPVIRAAMERTGQRADDDTVVIPEGDREFTEEERSRRPTVFTALREITAAFGCEDPHLGLYGAFGYDLAFQFEPVRPRLERPATQRDLVLHLPDEIWIMDRMREEAVRYSYEFEVGRRVHRRARPHDGAHRAGARWPARSGARTAGTAAAGELCAGRGGGQGAVRPRGPVRGGAQPRVPRAVRVAGRLLRAAPAAQPGAVRVPVQPGRGGVPGRRVARDVRAGHRGPGGDLPDRGHDRARRGHPGGRGEHRRPARLGQGGVRADHVHRRGPQRQGAGLRARLGPGDRPAADRDVQPPHPHRRSHRGPAPPRLRRVRRLPHPHVGGHRDRGPEDLGHAVHRGSRGRPRAAGTAARSARSASTGP